MTQSVWSASNAPDGEVPLTWGALQEAFDLLRRATRIEVLYHASLSVPKTFTDPETGEVREGLYVMNLSTAPYRADGAERVVLLHPTHVAALTQACAEAGITLRPINWGRDVVYTFEPPKPMYRYSPRHFVRLR